MSDFQFTGAILQRAVETRQQNIVTDFCNHQWMQTLGQRIRQVRTEKGISRKQLSAKTKIGYSTISEIERGGVHTTTKLHLFAQALDVSDGWLATGHGPRERGVAPVADVASRGPGIDRAAMRQALIGAERLIAARAPKTGLSPERRAELVGLLYDMIIEGIDMDRAERVVAGALSALSSAPGETKQS